MNQFVYNSTLKTSIYGIGEALRGLLKTPYPVIICVGSDLVIGDSLGPLIGSELEAFLNGKAYVYGTLDSPVTAKEIKTLKNTINLLHPKSKILVIDAAVGDREEIGKIKVKNVGIKPGLGVNKDLDYIGDVSIIGIVSDKDLAKTSIYSETRLSLIKKLSNIIVGGVLEYLK